jgi:mono/diheme cytochrome c family protein
MSSGVSSGPTASRLPRGRTATYLAAAVWLCALLSPELPAQAQRRTIWDGVFTEAQAARGQDGYLEACARCHADDLLGVDDAPPLLGEPFLGRFNRLTADDVVQTIRRTMPQDAPDSLGSSAYVDLVSYLFKANGSPAGAVELPTDRSALQQVVVTNRQGES